MALNLIFSISQLSLATSNLAEAIAMEVLKGKIRELWEKHQSDIKSIIKLNEFLQKITVTKELDSLLQSAKISAAKNWEFVEIHLIKQAEFINKLVDNMKDIHQKVNNISAPSAGNIGLATMGLGFASLAAWHTFSPQSFKNFWTNPKSLPGKIIKGIKSGALKIKS